MIDRSSEGSDLAIDKSRDNFMEKMKEMYSNSTEIEVINWSNGRSTIVPGSH